MGIRYTGPYAEQVEDHEGHAARKLIDGTVSTTWTEETSTLRAFVAACSCGWRAEVDHAATETGREAAEAQWNAEHLSPLIEAARAAWESWPDDLAGLAQYARDRLEAQDVVEALRILDQMVADVSYRRRTVAQLATQQDRGPRE
jgi:thioredoxin-like negative regulator of GroEL